MFCDPFGVKFVKSVKSVSRSIVLHMDVQLFEHHCWKDHLGSIVLPLSKISWLYFYEFISGYSIVVSIGICKDCYLFVCICLIKLLILLLSFFLSAYIYTCFYLKYRWVWKNKSFCLMGISPVGSNRRVNPNLSSFYV